MAAGGFLWGLFLLFRVVVGGLPATAQHTQGRVEAARLPISIVSVSSVGHDSINKSSLSIAGEFDFVTGQTSTEHPRPSLRAQGRAAAVRLLELSLGAADLVDADLAEALGVSTTVARGLRLGHRCFGVGDLIVVQRRLPALFALLIGAFDRPEQP